MGFFAILVLTPIYSVDQSGEDLSEYLSQGQHQPQRIERLQIGNVTEDERLWASVMVTTLLSAFALAWGWSELMTFLKLRQEFLFRTATRSSSRVVLLQDLPPFLQSVKALTQLFADAPGGGVEHVYLVRDSSALERAVKQRQHCLDRLEQTEARYMDDIARASALVATTTLLSRTRSCVGNMMDSIRACFGGELAGSCRGGPIAGPGATVSAVSGGPGTSRILQYPEDDDYVGPLKFYQLDDVPKLSLMDLSNPASYRRPSLFPTGRASGRGVSISAFGTGSRGDGVHGTTMTGVSTIEASSTASGLSTLKWFQKPRRPRHYIGIPLLSKRQDSIRYYRGELCRLNKLIAQLSDDQTKAIAADQQLLKDLQQGSGPCRQSRLYNQQQQQSTTISPSPNPSTPNSDAPTSSVHAGNGGTTTLPSAFLLMRTRAGAKAVASGAVAADHITVDSRVLGIAPRDIEWRVLGQGRRSKTAWFFSRIMVFVVGMVLLIGCGLVVSAITSFAVFRSWTRVSAAPASGPLGGEEFLPGPGAYLRQGVLAPLLLTALMSAASWILNELCQFWGRVSKAQTELAIQRYCFLFLIINIGLVHPMLSLSFSWQESETNVSSSLATFLVHAIPSYCSFAFSYVLIAGLTLSLVQLLQLPRLIATLPALTLWSALGPLSWRKSTAQTSRMKSKSKKSGSTLTASAEDTVGRSSTAATSNVHGVNGDQDGEDASLFEANFAPAPTQTPRQAFQLRQPPFFQLHNIYPHLILLFTLSFALLPLSPLLFLLWIFVIATLNLSYRYLVLQVVTTKNQSGGLHYRQAIGFILFPTFACPALVLVVYLIAREAWVPAGFMVVVLLSIVGMRFVIGHQFAKRERRMLDRVEAFHQQPKKSMGGQTKRLILAGSRSRNAGPTDGSTSDSALTAITIAASTATNSKVVDLRRLNRTDKGASEIPSPLEASPMDLEIGQVTSIADIDGRHEHEEDHNGAGDGEVQDVHLSPVRRRMKKIMKRPTTIIGQVRHSLASGILTPHCGTNNSRRSSTARPKSVPVFDIDRYEREILGIRYDGEGNIRGEGRNRHRGHGYGVDQHHLTGGDTTMVESLQVQTEKSIEMPIDAVARDIFHAQAGSSAPPARAFTTAGVRRSSEYGLDLFGPDSSSFFASGYSVHPSGVALTSVVRSKVQQEEEEKEAKYREIVIALRRASSVASRKNMTVDGIHVNMDEPMSRRIRGTGPTSAMEALVESRMAPGQYAPRRPMSSSGVGRSHFRAPLPNLPNTYNNVSSPPHSRHVNNPYLHKALHSTLSSSPSNGLLGSGAPSLPMLLIHRESVVAAKECSRIQNLYLNPVLQEARAKVVVWLPSQTEVSFMGGPNAGASTGGGQGVQGGAEWGQCKYHAALRVIHATNNNFMSTSTLSPTEGQDGSEDNTIQSLQRKRSLLRSKKYPCTCQVYQELLKSVADAVALADQEIRDLRIVGLTVWLDSRHVVWGTEHEEEGKLGDRVMISTGPMHNGFSSGSLNNHKAQVLLPRQVGDGLLSWLEPEGPDSEQWRSNPNSSTMGQGAVGIVGGSIGVVMKRPIGSYGKLVGDGEEEDDIQSR
ncbi:hypothetical protein BGZ83_004154 [Gryganskiella cystojenkinii]|nr:hypothetical protein BGZ83_004154 [Gryganskiella cystojenkinii]